MSSFEGLLKMELFVARFLRCICIYIMIGLGRQSGILLFFDELSFNGNF